MLQGTQFPIITQNSWRMLHTEITVFVLWESWVTYCYVVWKNVDFFFVLHEVTRETVYVARCVRLTSVPLEKQVRNLYYMLWLCVCSFTYSAYCHMWPLRLHNICPHKHTTQLIVAYRNFVTASINERVLCRPRSFVCPLVTRYQRLNCLLDFHNI